MQINTIVTRALRLNALAVFVCAGTACFSAQRLLVSQGMPYSYNFTSLDLVQTWTNNNFPQTSCGGGGFGFDSLFLYDHAGATSMIRTEFFVQSTNEAPFYTQDWPISTNTNNWSIALDETGSQWTNSHGVFRLSLLSGDSVELSYLSLHSSSTVKMIP